MANVYAKPNAGLRLFLEEAPPGLIGTLTVAVTEEDGVTPVIEASTAGISETRTGDTSTYDVDIEAPPAGAYRIVWDLPDPAADVVQTFEVLDQPPAAAAANSLIAPSVAEVADLVFARTRAGKTTGGRLVGTFTDDTEPTGDKVRSLIEKAVREVANHIGDAPDAAVVSNARDAAALYAASLVELTRFLAEGSRDRSTYEQLRELYGERLKETVRLAQEVAHGDSDPSEANDANQPADTFATPVVIDADGTPRAYSWFTDTF